MVTELSKENGEKILPHLVQAAKSLQTIPYGDLAEKIDVHHRAIRYALGYVRDDICSARGLPLITSIVVNGTTGLPGSDWLPEGTAHLSKEEYKNKFEKYRDEVFAHQGWDDLLKELGLQPVKPEPKDLDARGRAYSDYMERHSNGSVGEGEDHRLLKEFIAIHPEDIGITPVAPAEIEYLFISGDRCDVVFDLGKDGWAVVEIKNGDPGELVKGIYQAVKVSCLDAGRKGTW